MPIVRALPLFDNGRAILELRNDFEKPVIVKNIFRSPETAGPAMPLLAEQINLFIT